MSSAGLVQVRGGLGNFASRAVTTWACWERTLPASGCSKMVRTSAGTRGCADFGTLVSRFLWVMRPAALPRRAGQHRGDGVAEPGVAVAGDELHAGQAAGDQAAQERQPPRPSSDDATSMPRISRFPFALTPVATRACTFTVRPPSRTFWVSASIHMNAYGALSSLRFRNPATIWSSSAAITLTWDLDSFVTPRDSASFSARRVETPGR